MTAKNFYSRMNIILFPGYMNTLTKVKTFNYRSFTKKPSIIALDRYNNDTAKKIIV